MPAPLFSRFYRRVADDTKHLPHHGYDRLRIGLLEHRVRAKVYTLDDAAAHEAGRIASLPPHRLLPLFAGLRMPFTDIWVEFNLPPMRQALIENGLDTIPSDEGLPERVGFGIVQRAAADDIVAVTFARFPNGSTMLGRFLLYLSGKSGELTPEAIAARNSLSLRTGVNMLAAGVGGAYSEVFANDPKLTEFMDRLDAAPLLPKGRTNMLDYVRESLAFTAQASGQARLAAACLAVITAATARPALRAAKEVQERSKDSPRRNTTITEVSLFTPEARPRRLITERVHQAITREAAKKREHDVSGHWNYRKKGVEKFDKLFCPDGQPHDFERDILNDHREGCTRCGAARWFKNSFKRGDPALGQAPRKVHNVHGAVT